MEQLAKEIHKPVKRKFKRRKVNVFDIDDIWSADIADLSTWSRSNKGYRYILSVIDVFSKYVWVIPLKTKAASEVVRAFKSITNRYKPKMLWTDQGGEFYNSRMSKWMKDNNIMIYSTYGDSKASVIERFHRTLKNKIWQRFTKNNNRKWINILDDLINEYNNTTHTTTGYSPIEARDRSKTIEIYGRAYMNDYRSIPKAKFKVGDRVRISRLKNIFEKEAFNWSYEVFEVVEVLNTDPRTYKIKDELGEVLEGSFYEQELQKTKIDFFLIEKILKTKGKGKNKQYYVKYVGHNDKFNMWLNANQINDLNQI